MFIVISFLGLLGALFGAVVEGDNSGFIPALTLTVIGLGLYAFGAKHAPDEPEPQYSKKVVAIQMLSGFLLVLQGIFLIGSLPFIFHSFFLIMESFNGRKIEDTESIAAAILAVLISVGIWMLRKKLRAEANKTAAS